MDKYANQNNNIHINEIEESTVVVLHNNGKDTASPTTVFDLPRQVWLDIYEHLDYQSYLNLRITCHHFLYLIDNYIGIRADFSFSRDFKSSDDDAFQFFKSVVLNEVRFEDCQDSSRYNFHNIFSHPNCLKEVSFTGATNLKLIQDTILNCHHLHLVEMSMDCKIVIKNETHRRSIDIDDECNILETLPGINGMDSHILPCTCFLNTVECLKLVPGHQDDNNLRTSIVLSLLRATRSEGLRKVIFQCELTDKIKLIDLLTTTVELMEKHPKLEALFMAILNEEFLMSDSEETEYYSYLDLETIDQFDDFRRRITATGKYLNIRKMGVTMINSNMQKIFTDFLRTQNHLVHLSLTVNIEPSTFSQEMFDTFSGTLEQLAIRGKFEEPFNFQFITTCIKLKEICLHNLQEHGGGGITPKCVNMNAIPTCLESFILFQVVVRTEELQLAVKKLQRLTTLVVFKCGHAAGETGISLECLQDILFKRTLQSILMVQFICASTSEAENLAGILFNMSRNSNMRRPSSQQRLRSPDDPPVQNEANNVLYLHQIDAMNEDDMIFHPRVEVHRNAQEQTVSRDIRTIAIGELGEASLLEDVQETAAGELPEGLHGELMTEIFRNSLDIEERQDVAAAAGGGMTVPESLTTGISMEAGNANTTSMQGGSTAAISLPSSAALPLRMEAGINEGGRDNERVLNMLQDILEHAVVQDPEFLEQRNPHLQDNMFLNRVNEINDDVELILDVEDQDLGPVLDLFEAERLAREHNVQVGFILDGVIDIMNEDAIRSKWLCVEDEEGHLTYTLKISVEL